MNRKYIILGTFLSLGLVSCDPMNDIYQEIDDNQSPIVKSGEYTLVTADYTNISKVALAEEGITDEKKAAANNVKSTNTLNELITPQVYIPALLSKSYPDWGKKSKVKVTYKIQNKLPETVLAMSKATSYILGEDDYAFVWGNKPVVNFLTPNTSPAEYLPKVLANAKKNAVSGDLVVVDYKYDTAEPEIVAGETLYEQGFEGLSSTTPDSKKNYDIEKLEGWKVINTFGDKKWLGRVYDSNYYAQCSAYGASAESFSWMISPAIAIKAGAQFTYSMKTGNYVGESLRIMVATTFNGTDIIDADWTDITSSFTFQNGGKEYTDWYSPGSADLSKYAGKNVYIAFKNAGSKTLTTTYQVDNVIVSTTRMAPTHEKPFAEMYQFDGTNWKPFGMKNIYLVTPEDYASMGITEFGSALPENYLPELLAKKVSYTQIGSAKTVVYKTYVSATKTIVPTASEFIYSADRIWTINNAVTTVTSQFVNIGDNKWIYDPSVYYTVIKGDKNLQRIVDYVVEHNPTYVDNYKTAEYYYGASEYQGNFSFSVNDRVNKYGKDPELAKLKDVEEQAAFMFKRASEGLCIMLKDMHKDDAKSEVDGITLDYYVTFTVYLNPAESGTRNNYTMQFNYDGAKFIQVGDVVKVE